LAKRTEWTQEQVDLIKRTIAPSASNDELQLFLQAAKSRGLDPFKRQIYLVPRKAKVNGQWVEKQSPECSIDGYRLIAERTGKYAGQLGPQWCGEDAEWKDVWLDKKPPRAARVGVLRADFKGAMWGIARWDSYCPIYNGQPSAMWKKMPDLMLAKCAEANGLRRAFPEELAGIYTSEEMGQADTTPRSIDAPEIGPEMAAVAEEQAQKRLDGKARAEEWMKELATIAGIAKAGNQDKGFEELIRWCHFNGHELHHKTENNARARMFTALYKLGKLVGYGKPVVDDLVKKAPEVPIERTDPSTGEVTLEEEEVPDAT
jgi:phage recombination protein Bet